MATFRLGRALDHLRHNQRSTACRCIRRTHVRHASVPASVNPLLLHQEMPRFRQIEPVHVEPAIEVLIEQQLSSLTELELRLDRLGADVTPADVLVPLEEISAPLSFAWGLVNHLMAVKNSDELRAAQAKMQPKVVELGSRFAQSLPLYHALKFLETDGESLDQGERRAVEAGVKDAEQGGVALEGAAKDRFNAIKQRLAELSTTFSNNVLDATKAYELVVADKTELEGLPPSTLALAAQNAGGGATAEAGPWKLTLDMPIMLPVMQFAHSTALRETLYRANISKASAGEQDNQPLIDEILTLRAELSVLLGFECYAEVSTSRKMAQTPAAVLQMTEQLHQKAHPAALRELEELQHFAGESAPLANWDMSYWSEKLRQERFEVSDEEVRPYLPLPKVLAGLFELSDQLFGVSISEAAGIETWNDDVMCFDVTSSDDGSPLATFFLDPYARPADKRGGAWMNSATGRSSALAPPGQDRLLPVCYLVCNQTPPVGDMPSLMTYREAETLFHEFGHGLQHMVTRVDNGLVSGIANVEWDAVELPSQFMENWLYSTYEVIQGISAHVETGEPLPRELWEKMVLARQHMAGQAMLRQLFFGMVDMELHQRNTSAGDDALGTFRKVAETYTVLPPLPEDRFLCSFSHIFAGGYAAGYYSYKWAEVLSADAFGAFEEDGLVENGIESVALTGRRFRETVLALGGSVHPMEVFKAFRGREPTVEALLRHTGL